MGARPRTGFPTDSSRSIPSRPFTARVPWCRLADTTLPGVVPSVLPKSTGVLPVQGMPFELSSGSRTLSPDPSLGEGWVVSVVAGSCPRVPVLRVTVFLWSPYHPDGATV